MSSYFEEPKAKLASLEKRIHDGLTETAKHLREIAKALRTIKNEGLHFHAGLSFADYVKAKFNFTGRYADDLIDHADRCDEAETKGYPLPTMRSSRELSRLGPPRLEHAWPIVVNRKWDGKMLRQFVASINDEAADTAEQAAAVANGLAAKPAVYKPKLSREFVKRRTDLANAVREALSDDDLEKVFADFLGSQKLKAVA